MSKIHGYFGTDTTYCGRKTKNLDFSNFGFLDAVDCKQCRKSYSYFVDRENEKTRTNNPQ